MEGVELGGVDSLLVFATDTQKYKMILMLSISPFCKKYKLISKKLIFLDCIFFSSFCKNKEIMIIQEIPGLQQKIQMDRVLLYNYLE